MNMIGHNRSRGGRVYAIVFDLDQETLGRLYHGNNANNAYADSRRFLTARGFEWKQGSTYFGDPELIDAVKCVTVVQKLARQYDWFTPSVRDIRMLRIEENNDLKSAIEDEDLA
jgi:virulence-associated protein VapD